MSEHGEEGEKVPVRMSEARGRRRPASTEQPANDDVLRDIFLRLPPLPLSLVRASAVCSSWLGLTSDPSFRRLFRDHHRIPPLLGYFDDNRRFVSTMDPPNRIPAARFAMPELQGNDYEILGCRHGLVLLLSQRQKEIVAWNPVAGSNCCVPFPPGATLASGGAVLRADGGNDGSQLGPFQVLMVFGSNGGRRGPPYAQFYRSESCIWGKRVAPTAPADWTPAVAVDRMAMVLLWDGIPMMIQLQSLKFRKVSDQITLGRPYYPFASFFGTSNNI